MEIATDALLVGGVPAERILHERFDYAPSLVLTEFATSQYALLTSVCALPGSLLAGTSGFIIKETGFASFFVGTSLMGLPGALLAWWIWRVQERLGRDLPVETSPERVVETD
ncbi:hypothetical protein [Methylocystis sp. IM4]